MYRVYFILGGNFHRTSILSNVAQKKGTNISASLSISKTKEMKDSRSALLKIISSLLYLSKQGLAVRGHVDASSNIQQLLILRADDVPELKSWLLRTKNKWLSHDVQNEILSLLSQEVQLNIISKIKNAFCFSIILDETRDISNVEQVSVCFRVVDDHLNIEEYFIGFFETPFTDAETLFTLVMNILNRFEIDISKCRGQCYDGAANVSGHISGLQKRITDVESRAIFVHCTAHTLNLVVQDAMQNINKIRDFLSTLRSLIAFVKDSPKRQAIFNSLQAEQSVTGLSNKVSIRPFCPTRWCVRIASLKTIDSNYNILRIFLEQLSSEKNETGAKASGFSKQLYKFDFYFLMHMMIFIFERIEYLNSELQKKSLHFQGARLKIQAIIMSIKEKRKSGFDQLWENVNNKSEELGLGVVKQPKQKKIPKRLMDGEEGHYFMTAKDQYRALFIEVIDITLSALQTRFQSNVIEHLATVEHFIVDSEKINTSIITDYYGSDFDKTKLELHRNIMLDIAKSKEFNISSVSDAIDFLKQELYLRDLVPEVVKLIKIILTVPVSSCTSERSFSALRRLKTFLRSTITQARLNDVAILHVHKQETINIDDIANKFIKATKVRQNTFEMII